MRGSIDARGRGLWRIRYDLPRGEDGKRKTRSVSFRGTKTAAQAHLAQLLHEQHTGLAVAPGKLTLAQFLDRWLVDYAQAHWSESALRPARGHVKNHLKPALGHHLLTALRPLHVQAYYTQKRAEGRLSEQTLLHHHRLLKQSLGQAVKWGLLGRNVMEGVTAPRPRPEKAHAFTEAQVVDLVSGARGTMLYLPILLALSTGMRRGEILGLRWEDVDLKQGLLAVRRSVRENGHTGPPKSGKARVVTLPGVAVEALAKHKALGLGESVIAWPDGRPVRCDFVTQSFAILCRRLSLPSTRFHDLRHTHASVLLLERVHPKVVSERLGHTNIAITMDRYSHLLPGIQEEAARAVDGALRAAFED